jgi:hypothetical protein
MRAPGVKCLCRNGLRAGAVFRGLFRFLAFSMLK